MADTASAAATPPRVIVYVLCPDAASHATACREWGHHPWARVVTLPDEPAVQRYMEGSAFLRVLPERREEWQDADYVGTLSWRAGEKIFVPDVAALCSGAQQADVLALLPSTEHLCMQAQKSHCRFLEVWIPLLQHLGFSARDAVSHAMPCFLCNYWLARPRWMSEFLEFYQAAVRALETLPEVQEPLWADAGYGMPLTPERCRAIYGVPYMPHHPFVGERLACFFFWKRQATIALVPLGKPTFWEKHYQWELADVQGRATHLATTLGFPPGDKQ